MVQRSGVLIETYWNVKNEGKRTNGALLSINRNILECKDIMGLSSDSLNNVLIETYWNVKKNTELLAQKQELRINRNILECKGTKYTSGRKSA